MKALVTGGAGFIGSNLVKVLQDAKWQVRVLDNLSTGHRENLRDFDVELLVGDIRDEELALRVCTGVQAVFHLAASIGNKQSIEHPQADSSVNAVGTVNMIDAARRRGVERFIYSSSAAIFGELLTSSIDEDHPTRPTSPYGVSKLAGENQVACFHRLYNLMTVSLRYFNVYGPKQRFDEYGNVIPIFTRQLLAGEPLTIFGDGEQTRDFVNVKDVAMANFLSATRLSASCVLNVGSGSRITINALVRILEEVSGRRATVRHAPPRPGEVIHCQANIARLKAELGYDPSSDFAAGLREYVEWFARMDAGHARP